LTSCIQQRTNPRVPHSRQSFIKPASCISKRLRRLQASDVHARVVVLRGVVGARDEGALGPRLGAAVRGVDVGAGDVPHVGELPRVQGVSHRGRGGHVSHHRGMTRQARRRQRERGCCEPSANPLFGLVAGVTATPAWTAYLNPCTCPLEGTRHACTGRLVPCRVKSRHARVPHHRSACSPRQHAVTRERKR